VRRVFICKIKSFIFSSFDTATMNYRDFPLVEKTVSPPLYG
jgi:hypothetical protein